MADTNGRSSRSRSRRAAPRSTRSSGHSPGRATASRTAGSSGAPSARGRAASSRRKRKLVDYPRAGFTGVHRWLPSWRFVLGTGLAGCFLLAGAFVAAYATVKVPKAGEEIGAQVTTVYFAGDEPGKPGPVMGTLPGVNRQIVEYSSLPDYVGRAVAAGEDKTFFTNSGIDLKGMSRALLNNLKGGPTQGGSSLTQEYVERYYVGSTTTSYYGKLKETLLALKIGRTESKDEILGRYLNTIYFGRGAYGIQAASQAYFGVDADKLTVSQAALLAGVIPSPSYWDPAVSPDKAEFRWNVILDSMESMGWISASERAAQQFPTTLAVKTSDHFAGTNGYLLQQVMAELEKPPYGMTEEDIERGGFSIVTTIQKPAQEAAVATANKMWDGSLWDGKPGGKKPDPHARLAIVSIDPTDGAIVAEYAGKDFLTDQRSTATYDKVQAGSTFKAFTLVAALEQGIGLETRFNGRSPQKLPGWDKPVTNFDNEQPGTIDLIKATEDSVNTVYAQLNNKIGPDKTVDAAVAAGIRSPVPDVPSNVLGVADVSPLELTDAYATFAAQGKHSSSFIVRTVLNPNGTVRFTAKPDTKQVFSPDVVSDATYAMQQVIQKGTGEKWIRPLDRPIAGKSGTTSDVKSALFAAYTPQIATVVSLSQLGDDDKAKVSITPIEDYVETPAYNGQTTGGTTPAHLWADYMSQVFELPQFADKTPFPERAGHVPTVGKTPTPTPTTEPTPTQTQPATVPVPDGLPGRLEADASSALYAVGLTPKITSASSDTVAAGRVISVSPGEDTKVAVGDAVTLVISTGPKTPPTPTPTPTDVQDPAPSESPTGGAPGPGAGDTGSGADGADGADGKGPDATAPAGSGGAAGKAAGAVGAAGAAGRAAGAGGAASPGDQG